MPLCGGVFRLQVGKRVRSSEVERPACPGGRGFESHRVLHANSSVVERKIRVLLVMGSNPITQMACKASNGETLIETGKYRPACQPANI